MKGPLIILAAVAVTGDLAIDESHAAFLAAAGLDRPAPDFLPVRTAERIDRMRQQRAILENALRAPEQAVPAQPMEPQTAPLYPPEPAPAPQADLPAAEQLSCEAAAEIVANYGFSAVQATDCSGERYAFSAIRDDTAYAIEITAAGGEIAEVRRQ